MPRVPKSLYQHTCLTKLLIGHHCFVLVLNSDMNENVIDKKFEHKMNIHVVLKVLQTNIVAHAM